MSGFRSGCHEQLESAFDQLQIRGCGSPENELSGFHRGASPQGRGHERRNSSNCEPKHPGMDHFLHGRRQCPPPLAGEVTVSTDRPRNEWWSTSARLGSAYAVPANVERSSAYNHFISRFLHDFEKKCEILYAPRMFHFPTACYLEIFAEIVQHT